MKKYLKLLIALTILLISCDKNDDTPAKVGGLKGKVLNSFDQPIEGAIIKISQYKTTSNSLGNYSFSDLLVDKIQVSASKEFFLTEVKEISITENEIAELDFILNSGVTYLNISDSVETVGPESGEYTISIESNSDWMTKCSSSEVICSRSIGEGNDDVQISWTKNQTLTDKYDTIKFISGSITKSFILKRTAPIILLNYEGIAGDINKGISDSVYLSFNKPVKVKSLVSNYQNCQCDINYNMVDGGKGIRFTYNCAKLGGSYPFTVSLSDQTGNLFSFKFEVPFYKSKLHLAGYISNYLMINDDKELLIATYMPNRIIRYSIELDSILSIYDLSGLIAPTKITYNPYNSKVYICGAKPGTETKLLAASLPYYFTLDMETGEISRSATIEPNLQHHTEDIENIPCGFGFTKTGKGIVILVGDYFSHWEIMDCTNNDSIYIYPYGDYNINASTKISRMYQNYDMSKLWIIQLYGDCEYLIFDGTSERVTPLISPVVTSSGFITPNKKNDNVFVGQLYAQFIMDINGNRLSEMSYNGGDYLSGSDFSYRENEESFIYTLSDNYLELADYSRAQTLSINDILYGCAGLKATSDGNYLVTCKGGSDISSYIYVFETKCLYRHLNK